MYTQATRMIEIKTTLLRQFNDTQPQPQRIYMTPPHIYTL
jgi:hypothetical protein